MVECDDCGSDVHTVWRHRVIDETATHRVTRWACRSCHPELPGGRHGATEPEAVSDAGDRVVLTDGGRAACPECAGDTVSGQGLFACGSCDWTGVR